MLRGWDYEPGTINVRKVSGLDGNAKLQMRLDLGPVVEFRRRLSPALSHELPVLDLAAPLMLPSQGVDQFFASASISV